jgi:hypothetical protein
MSVLLEIFTLTLLRPQKLQVYLLCCDTSIFRIPFRSDAVIERSSELIAIIQYLIEAHLRIGRRTFL